MVKDHGLVIEMEQVGRLMGISPGVVVIDPTIDMRVVMEL